MDPIKCEHYSHHWRTEKDATVVRIWFNRDGSPGVPGFYCGPHAGGQKRKESNSSRANWGFPQYVTMKAWVAGSAAEVEKAKVAIEAERVEWRKAQEEAVAAAKKAQEEREKKAAERATRLNAFIWERSFDQFSISDEPFPSAGWVGARFWTLKKPDGSETDVKISVTRNDADSPWQVILNTQYLRYFESDAEGELGAYITPTDMAFMVGTALQEAAAYAESLNEREYKARKK